MIESILQNELCKSEKALTDKAINSRMSRARRAEKVLGYSLDRAVSTDEKMYESLCSLKEHDTNGQLQNALRWYYKAKVGKDFPRLSEYALLRKHGIDIRGAANV